MKAKKISISVIIPVHNGGEFFRQCLSSLAQAVPSPEEIIVVANGDTDGSGHLAEEFGATVMRVPEAIGPAEARNLGAQAATSDILFFVDADVAIRPETVGQVAMCFEQEPEITALMGSYDDAPGASNFLSQYKNLFHHYTHQQASEEASTFWGACGAIRSDVFKKIGGFNESYRQPCVEDIELGYRLKQSGYKIKLNKDLRVKHLKRWGVISLLRADFFYRALPWTALILRNNQLKNDLNLQWSSRISVVLVYALLGAIVAAWWWSVTLITACIFILALLAINWSVYQFFHNKRGIVFAIQTVPWHWLYYFYSGIAFAIGIIRHLFSLAAKNSESVLENV